MEHHPETESGVDSSDNMNLEAMSIQDLVSVLRTAFLTQDFDNVEDVLVDRDKRLQSEILRLQDMVELEKLTRFQAEEDLRKKEELCERGKRAQNHYEKLLKEVKKNSNLEDRDIIGELRKKNKELEFEVCELRKLKEKWVDDSNALSELKDKVDVLENDNNALRVKNSELEASMEKNSEALSDHVIPDSEDSDEESDGDNGPPSKRSKNEQDASSSGMKNINVVVPPSNVQKQVVTQTEAKRILSVISPTSYSFDSFRFISLVHQERYSKFLANKDFWSEAKSQLEWDKLSNIQGMILSRGWVKLTCFVKVASKTLAKEFLANAYQDPAKENGNNKNDLIQYTSFVRGRKVPFDGKIINQLFGLENYEHCSFEARAAKGSNIDYQEVLSTLCRPEISLVRNEDGTPRNKFNYSDLTPIAKAWIKFVRHTLLPCSNVSVGSNKIKKPALLLTALVKGEPVNVGRLLANNLWATANCSSPMICFIHASLIGKLCERVGVYPNINEGMVKPSTPFIGQHNVGYNIQVPYPSLAPINAWREISPSIPSISISRWPNPTPGPTNPRGQIPPSISGWPNPTPRPTNPWGQFPPPISRWPSPTPATTNPRGQIPPSISGWPSPTPGTTNPRGQIPPPISKWPSPTPGTTNPRGQIPPPISKWPSPTPGTTNPRGQIPPPISNWPSPTPGTTNPWGQIPPPISKWPSPTPGTTNPQGQIPQIPPPNSKWPSPTPEPVQLQERPIHGDKSHRQLANGPIEDCKDLY